MIWLMGDKGMLGGELSDLFRRRGMDFFGTDRDCDIADPEALRAACAGKHIDWIVNCAGYTAVDRAEEEPLLARRANATGPLSIARLAADIGARLVHISTDHVFDGRASRPYEEDDPVSPSNMYGRTKAEGEYFLRRECGRHFILRSAWLYGRHGGNFVHTILKLMESGESLGVVADQRGSPTSASDLAGAISGIILRDSEAFGTYHYTDEGDISRYDFALEIRRLGLENGLLAREIPLRPLKSGEYPARAVRPAYAVLSKRKAREVLGFETPAWDRSLCEYIASMAEASSRAIGDSAADAVSAIHHQKERT
jgi:dTDP-4-dehydrorhamnose reductase